MTLKKQNSKNNAPQLPLAISIGEPAGVGPEIILKAWLARKEKMLAPFIVLGDSDFLQRTADTLQLNMKVQSSKLGDCHSVFDEALPVLDLSSKIVGSVGKPNTQDGAHICEAINNGAIYAMEGKVSGLVTAPINKEALYAAGFEHPGHTEFLADIAAQYTRQPVHPVMLLSGPDLKTVPVTIHIALKEVVNQLTSELIVKTGEITHHDLVSKFGIETPRIAIAGLNPHAGENGSMGMEDINIVQPAVKALQEKGINAFGPLPSDTMFHARARAQYDVALCMYHDQALIPAKTLAFDESVNVTLGLPFIRTSPDHGTAYDIAGKGIAKIDSMVAAIQLASQMANDNANNKNSPKDASS